MTYVIKDRGNYCECSSAADVAIALQRYRGKSVSIEDRRGGAVHFVDVSLTGEVTETYRGRPFDVESQLG